MGVYFGADGLQKIITSLKKIEKKKARKSEFVL